MTSIPDSLKPLGPFIKHANMFEKKDPIVAYYCRFHVAQEGIKLSKGDKEGQVYLLGLMDRLEADKKNPEIDHEALTNDIVGQAHVEEFAMKLFSHADNEDRAGRANKGIALTFYSAMICFDVLAALGPMRDDLEDKHKYAKYKAAYILKCLKEGTTPQPGPPGGEEEEKEEEERGGAGGMMGGGGYDDTVNSHEQSRTYGNETETVEPVRHLPTPPGYHREPPAVPPPMGGGVNVNSQPVAPTAPAPGYAPAPVSNPGRGGGGGGSVAAVGHGNSVHNAGYTSGIPTEWKPPATNLSEREIEAAQKKCKFAMSALNYDDVPTAVSSLTEALKILTNTQ
eukprot:Nk52_evm16s327 gene=Nk52_evmTU16s327